MRQDTVIHCTTALQQGMSPQSKRSCAGFGNCSRMFRATTSHCTGQQKFDVLSLQCSAWCQQHACVLVTGHRHLKVFCQSCCACVWHVCLQLPRAVVALAAKGDLTFAATGAAIHEAKRMHA
jgi:hypothetical protein